MPIVTIRGHLGSGAPEIGRQIAERLQVDYVDREIIAQVAARVNRDQQEVMDKETPPSSFLGRIGEALTHSSATGMGFEGAYLPTWQMPLDDIRYLEALRAVIRELAESQSIVILGRGSQFILKDYPRALHVLIVAPLQTRVKRVMEDMKSGEENARQEIARFDKSRREFTKRYFQAELENPAHYDLVINTEFLGFKDATSIVVEAIHHKDS